MLILVVANEPKNLLLKIIKSFSLTKAPDFIGGDVLTAHTSWPRSKQIVDNILHLVLPECSCNSKLPSWFFCQTRFQIFLIRTKKVAYNSISSSVSH